MNYNMQCCVLTSLKIVSLKTTGQCVLCCFSSKTENHHQAVGWERSINSHHSTKNNAGQRTVHVHGPLGSCETLRSGHNRLNVHM